MITRVPLSYGGQRYPVGLPIERGYTMTTAQRNEFLPLAEDIAKALSEDWTVKPSDASEGGWRVRMVRSTGGTVAVWRDRDHPDKVTLDGQFPDPPNGVRYSDVQHLAPKHDAHRIRVNPSRGPVVIAREIERRLLPDYLPALATWEAHMQQKAAAFEAQQKMLRILADILNTKPRKGSRNDHPEYVEWSPFGQGVARFVVDKDGDGARLESTHLSAEQAVAVAETLRAWND